VKIAEKQVVEFVDVDGRRKVQQVDLWASGEKRADDLLASLMLSEAFGGVTIIAAYWTLSDC